MRAMDFLPVMHRSARLANRALGLRLPRQKRPRMRRRLQPVSSGVRKRALPRTISHAVRCPANALPRGCPGEAVERLTTHANLLKARRRVASLAAAPSEVKRPNRGCKSTPYARLAAIP